jgi:glycosyltransferase involved in cell wall biosynthesis
MKRPFFSIITCTLNSEAFLPKNILSVKTQIFNNYEHIFIDGCSKDNSLKIIKRYQRENKGKVRIYQKKPQGISNAMNEGIKKAKGDFLIHLHADDSLHDENVLADVFDFLNKQKNVGWIYGKIQVVEKNGNKVGSFPNQYFLQNPNPFLLKFFNYVPHQSVFVKKEVFEKYGLFDESISSQMDLDLWLRISRKTKWAFFDRLISNFMIRAGAQSSGKKRQKTNLDNVFLVRKRYLNPIELFIFKLVNIFVETYNITRR